MRELTDEIKEKIKQKAQNELVGSPKTVIEDYIRLYEIAWINGEVEV